MPDDQPLTMLERLNRLEGENEALRRRLSVFQWIGAIAGGCLTLVALLGLITPLKTVAPASTQAASSPLVFNSIEAHQFVLVDDQGKDRAILQFDETGQPQLVFGGKQGTRVELGISGKNGVEFQGLSFKNEKNNTTMSLFANTRGPTLSLSDGTGKHRFTLMADHDSAFLSFSDPDPTSRAFVQMGLMSGGAGNVDVADHDGQIVKSLTNPEMDAIRPAP